MTFTNKLVFNLYIFTASCICKLFHIILFSLFSYNQFNLLMHTQKHTQLTTMTTTNRLPTPILMSVCCWLALLTGCAQLCVYMDLHGHVNINIKTKQNGGAKDGLDMNIGPAWQKGYTGKGVVVSILDDGIQTNHPDLAQNYVSFYIFI